MVLPLKNKAEPLQGIIIMLYFVLHLYPPPPPPKGFKMAYRSKLPFHVHCSSPTKKVRLRGDDYTKMTIQSNPNEDCPCFILHVSSALLGK